LNEDNAYPRFLTTLAQAVAERQSFCRAHGVLDVGCATGLVLASIVSQFAWGIGVDISPEMIRLAQAKQIPNARFLLGDCFELCRSVPTAGAVVSRGVLLSHYGWEHAKELLASNRAALSNGGFFLCDFLNRNPPTKFRHAPRNKTYFSPTEVSNLAIEVGFQTAHILGEPGSRVLMLLAQ
jgi:SAM-dependent methyltransferase